MVLSAVVVGAANGIDPMKFDGEQQGWVRFSCLAGFLIFINLKVLVIGTSLQPLPPLSSVISTFHFPLSHL